MDAVIRPGAQAPDFLLPDLQGKVHRLTEARGRVLVLDFWSAECPWAARADEQILRLLPEWGDAVRVWWLASNANETLEQLCQVAQERALPVVLRDEKQAVADRYGVQVTPHLFVIDSRGVIRYSGALDDVTFRQRTPTIQYLGPAVASVLAGRPPTPDEMPAYGCALVRAR